MPNEGHVTIDGVDYVVDLRSYRRHDIVDFSPRATVAGGSVFSELGLYQTLNFDDWQGGFGYPWQTATKDNVYLHTIGRVDTRHAGLAMLMTQATKSDSDYKVDGFDIFGGDVYSWSSDGVIKYTSSGATWAVVSTDANVSDLWNNGYYIFQCAASIPLKYAATDVGATSDWTETGATTDQTNFYWLTHHDGYVYAGQVIGTDGSSGHYVSYDDSILLGDIYTVSSDDPQIVPVGIPGMQVDKGISYRGDFLLPRPDGIYRMDKDRTAARRVLDYSDQTSTDNFRDWAIHNGQLVYPVRDELISWNGSRTVPITPPRLTVVPPYVTYGRYDNFTTVGNFLFMSARTNDAVIAEDTQAYEEHILCYDGVGYHKLAEPIMDGDGSITSLKFDPYNDRLWYAVNTSSDNDIYYIPFQANNPTGFPFGDYQKSSDMASTQQDAIIGPRIAAGFRRVHKSTPSVIMEGYNLSTGQYLELDYKHDGSTGWLPWGGDCGITNVMTSDGIKAFLNPLGLDKSTVEYKWIQYKIQLFTADSTQTPILEGFYPRLLMRPDTLWGWSMQIVASKDVQYGTGKQDMGAFDILDMVAAARDSKAPVTFTDVYGHEFQVYVSAVNEQAVEYHADRPGPHPDVEQVVQVNLVQVG